MTVCKTCESIDSNMTLPDGVSWCTECWDAECFTFVEDDEELARPDASAGEE